MSAIGSSSSQTWVEPKTKDKPPKDAGLKEVWPFLRDGVEHIMTRMQHTGMTFSYYILLYTAIYDFCTTPNKVTGHSFHASRTNGANLQGSELYRSLRDYLTQHCDALREEGEKLSDVELLKYYARQWDRYTTGALCLNKLFNYLNKHWVKREKDEGRKDVFVIFTLALVQWRDIFFRHIHQSENQPSRLTQAILRQIELARNGETVDNSLIKKVIESYVSLGIDDADAQRQILTVYRESFESYFLQATETYYRAESSAFVKSNSVSDYMKKAESRINEEMERVSLYLNDSTRKSLKEKCEKVLIAEHSQILSDEFQSLLDGDRVTDLARLYGLLGRIQSGLEPLRKQFEEYVKRAGFAAVEKVVPAPGAVNEAGKAETLDPKAYVEALLDVHKKFEQVVNGPFNGEIGFNASLDRACREFCNTNAAAKSSSKSPELLASYCDQLLKKSNRDLDPEALEATLDQALVIFKFIDDKDVFQKFYQKMLAQRLVKETSASDDAESSMITKLKNLAGFEYANNLTRMFSDITISREVTEKFNDKERASGKSDDLDFDVKVLGSNFWPLTAQQTDFTIPRQIKPKLDSFLRFYNHQHSGRKLTWLWHVSKNELKTTYLPQKYTFMTSAYQMAILTQFNENDSLSYQDIATGTSISEKILRPQLELLVKAKVLLHEGDKGDDYDLNLNFKSKKIRVQLNQAVRSEQKAETSEVLASVDEDRKFVYQATIVRLMKARKTMKHQALVQDVTATISTKFTPKVADIKKAIDYLIDKEYLERVHGEKDTYNYLA